MAKYIKQRENARTRATLCRNEKTEPIRATAKYPKCIQANYTETFKMHIHQQRCTIIFEFFGSCIGFCLSMVIANRQLFAIDGNIKHENNVKGMSLATDHHVTVCVRVAMMRCIDD